MSEPLEKLGTALVKSIALTCFYCKNSRYSLKKLLYKPVLKLRSETSHKLLIFMIPFTGAIFPTSISCTAAGEMIWRLTTAETS